MPCMPEESLYEDESQRSRGDIAARLRQAATEIEQGEVHLGDQTVTIPEEAEFEVELERETDAGTDETSYELEYEIEWSV